MPGACLTGEWNGMAWAALARFTEAEVLRRLGETRRPVVVGHDALHLASVRAPRGCRRRYELSHSPTSAVATSTRQTRWPQGLPIPLHCSRFPRTGVCGTMSSAAVAVGTSARRGACPRLSACVARRRPQMVSVVCRGDARGCPGDARRCGRRTVGTGTLRGGNPAQRRMAGCESDSGDGFACRRRRGDHSDRTVPRSSADFVRAPTGRRWRQQPVLGRPVR